MALTVVVRSGAFPGEPELALTLDAPRVVLGRGDGCEVRIPDATVSARHASLRQKGQGWVIVDEGSQNGTWAGKSKLSPHAAYPVQSGDLIRLGRVWLEVRVEAAVITRSGAAAAKELALGLVARALAAEGEEPGPRVTVTEGPDRGAALVLREPGRAYTVGRSRECDLVLADPEAGRKHVSVSRRGDALSVQDLGSSRPATLDGAELGPGDVTWRPGQELVVASSRLALEYAAADALLEIERGPDERLREGDVAPPPPLAGATPTPPPGVLDASPEAPAVLEESDAPPARDELVRGGGWGAVDGIVIVIAAVILVISAAGAWWLLGR